MEKSNISNFYLLGDRWIYFKIYLSNIETDRLLIDQVLPLTENLSNNNMIQLWFFIRYFDSNNHIRLRFLLRENQKLNQVIEEFNKQLYDDINEKIIWKLETAIYRPELDRYGMNTIDLTERFFYIDSKTILNFIVLEENKFSDPDIRWLFAMRYIDYLLHKFALNSINKLNIFLNLKTSFEREFGIDNISSKQINTKFRHNSRKMESFMNENLTWFKFLIDEDKSERNFIISEIKNKFSSNKSDVEFRNYLNSIIHMSMNRIFSAKNRFYELVLYTFLYKFYQKKSSFKKNHNFNTG